MLFEGRPSAYDGIEPETFEKSFVPPDWSAFMSEQPEDLAARVSSLVAS